MTESTERARESLPESGRTSLDVAAWHLQMLLTSVSSFDGKIMFLTALNVAGLSALIGITITSEPTTWLVSLGFVLASVCAAIGLGVLWSANLKQFPNPDEILSTSQGAGNDSGELVRQHFLSIREATSKADAQLRFRIRAMRVLLLVTPSALTVAIAAAITATA